MAKKLKRRYPVGVKKFKYMKLTFNADLRGYKAGTQINIKTDDRGMPVEKYYRRRLKDAGFDNCIELADIKKLKSEKPKQEKPKKDKGDV